ncbi:hypothetical protein A1O3_09099 [Capronia epimyces CBS 606.96]|uniref:Major facilitator superfamily (MFS) profile domain-containing protein n=1 Tax=Capronia epimyces CBS 606.96 TaxID=1182542 RepID=W9XKV0_9EURO|nr:uncharacterized protein A1O3_09099 [Capronia epimyces CBS 606.96]EXJ77940.1 hypothetical protein A1O3_09099 [Capronia epimyces CBS 606.96]
MVKFHTTQREIESVGPGRQYNVKTVLVILFMCFGSVSYAYSVSVISNTLGQPSFLEYMGLNTNPNAAAIIGAIPSLYFAGGFFGAICCEYIADRWGRKPAIAVGAVTTLISTAILAGSVNIAMFIAFRFINGFGALMLAMLVPLWITECAPPGVRGAFAQLNGVLLQVGYILSSYVGVGFFYYKGAGENVWRAPLALGCLPCLVLLAGLWWTPESPRFLLLKGRHEQALKITARLHSTASNANHEFVQKEMYQMRKQIELDRTLNASWVELLRRPSYRKRVFMAIFIVFSITGTGGVVIATFGPSLYEGLGYSPAKQLLLNAGIFATSIVGGLACVFYTEHMRRPTLIGIGLILCAVVVACFAALSKVYIGTTHKAGQAAAVSMTYLFFVAYGAFVEGPYYYYAPELFPTHLRAKGMAITIGTFTLFSIMWTQVTPTAIKNIGWRYFLVFIILSFVGGVIIWAFFPNTQGKSLEEIAALFGDDDLVVVYQKDVHVDLEAHRVVAEIHGEQEKQDVTGTLEEREVAAL